MKKLYLLLLFVSMSYVSALAQTWETSYTDDNGATWTFRRYSNWNSETQQYEYYVQLNGVQNYGDEITVPSTVTYNDTEYSVEVIGSSVFQDNKTVSNIIIPSSVKTIGYSSFKGCTNLKNIGDISNCETIGQYAFYGCSNLTHVDLSSCKIICDNAFYDCQMLQEIGSLAKTTRIAGWSFYNCESLKEIDLPANDCIESSAFKYCTRLNNVGSFDNSYIGNGAFYGCSSLKSIDLSKAKKIEANAFYGCSSLESVGDLSSITGLDNYVFQNCRSLKEVNLSSCKTIGSYAFYNCESLTSIDLSACQTLGSRAFSQCYNLKEVKGFAHMTNVAEGAFLGCNKLETIDLSNCKTVGAGAFNSCSSLTTLGTLPLCETIGDYAFYGCSNLGDVIIESTSITSMGKCAFSHNGSITFMQTTPFVLPEKAFKGGADDVIGYLFFKVPAESLTAYQTADVWKDYANRIFAIGDILDYELETIANDASSSLEEKIGRDNLNKVVSLKLSGTINSYDIIIIRNKTPNLHYLDLSDARIVESSYEYYTGYHTANDVIGPYFFANMDKFADVKLPKTTKTIGSYAFYKCNKLKSIEMYEGIESIENRAFYECLEINSITMPKGLLTIGEWAFYCCNKLETVTFPPSLEVLGQNCFYNCRGLKDVSLPTNLRTIESGAFLNCINLQEVRIPSSVIRINESAFAGCNQLTKVYTYTIEPTTINQNTFSNYTTATLFVPKTSFNNYYWDTEWSQFSKLEEFDEPYSYFYINKDYTLDDDRIDGTPDADLNPGGSLTVEGEEDQNIDELTIKDENDIAGSVIADDNISANRVKFEISVSANRWYFFAFPFDIPLSNIECDGQYVFRYYDGAARAQNGNGGWKNLPAETETLERGKGYIFQCDTSGKLILFIDEPDFKAEDVHQALTEHESERTQDAGWNFIGNPLTSYFNIDDTKYTAPITIWNSNTRSYEAIRPGDDDYYFHPFEAFFVQKPGSKDKIEFGKDGRTTYIKSKVKRANARRMRVTRGVDESRQFVDLTISDTEVRDKTRIVFNESASIGYETECDAAKFMSTEDVPQIYTVDNEGVQYAINERRTGEVKIAYLANKAGTYKIAAERMDKAVVLYDDVTKTEFDFANGDYSFETEAGTFENRFVLKAPAGAATGLAEIKKQTGVIVMGDDNGIYINNVGDAQVDIYSVGGVQLATKVQNGFVALPKATYIVKVNKLSTKVMVK